MLKIKKEKNYICAKHANLLLFLASAYQYFCFPTLSQLAHTDLYQQHNQWLEAHSVGHKNVP